MKKKIILSIIAIILLLSLVVAQGLIRFPNTFEITLPQLPPRQSENQIIFNCGYDSNIEYRMVGIRDLQWSGSVPQVLADVQYWTENRNCAGSRSFNLTLPITLSQQQLVGNFQNQINLKFLEEAQSNHQRSGRENRYIAGSSGLGTSVGEPGSGGL